MGYTVSYGRGMDLAKMTPQGACRPRDTAWPQTPSWGGISGVRAERRSFTVDLTAMRGAEPERGGCDPSTGTTSAGGAVAGGATRTFTSRSRRCGALSGLTPQVHS